MLTGLFLIKRIHQLETSQKKPYQVLDLVGIDQSRMRGIVWSPETVIEGDVLHENLVYMFDAEETTYRGDPQLTIKIAVKADDADLSDFLESPKILPENLFLQLVKLISSIKTDSYSQIAKLVIQNSDIEKKLKLIPKTLNYDYNYPGGLLHSILNLVQISKTVGETLLKETQQESKDLLICGALVCDIGKVIEIDSNFNLTADGDLLGHQFLGCRLLEEIDKKLDYEFHSEILKLCHCILVHHVDDIGNWSSVKIKFKEADMLRMISTLVIKTAGWDI